METVVVIFEPPADPDTKTTSPFLSKMMLGHIEDSGRLPGLIKLAGDGRNPTPLAFPGLEKSSISLFKMIPVLFERTVPPNLIKWKNNSN